MLMGRLLHGTVNSWSDYGSALVMVRRSCICALRFRCQTCSTNTVPYLTVPIRQEHCLCNCGSAPTKNFA